MKKVLFINASPKSKDTSITLQMADEFITAFKAQNPDDVVTTLNLYDENIQFLDVEDISEFYAPESLRPKVKKNKLNIMKYVDQFVEADRYIIAAPFWNLGTPAILKAYFDYVNISGITFKYTEAGAVGLLGGAGKKVAFIASRGGGYSEGHWKQFELGELGVRTQFKFFGIDDVEAVLMEWADVLKGEELESALAASMRNAKEKGARF